MNNQTNSKLVIASPNNAFRKVTPRLGQKELDDEELDNSGSFKLGEEDESEIPIQSPEDNESPINHPEPKRSPTNDTISLDLSRLENSKLFKKFVQQEYNKKAKPVPVAKESKKTPEESPEKSFTVNQEPCKRLTGFEETLGPVVRISDLPDKSAKKDPLVAQYEEMLEAAMRKNQELEKAVASQTQKSTRVIEHLRNQTEGELTSLLSKLECETKEKEEWMEKYKNLELEYKKDKLEWEKGTSAKSELAKKLEIVESNKSKLEEIEAGLRNYLIQATNKVALYEGEMRQKDEKIFSLQNENQQLKIDFNVQKEILEQLKGDYSGAFQKRASIELEMQGLKAKAYAYEISKRKLQQEIDRLEAENTGLTEQCEALTNTVEELKNENMELNKRLASIQKENAEIVSQLEKAKRNYQALEISFIKANTNSEMLTKTLADLKEDYEKLIEKHREVAGGSPVKVGRRVPALPVEKVHAIPKAESESTVSKYYEYKQRQNQSNLGSLLKWDTEQGKAAGSIDYSVVKPGNVMRPLSSSKVQLREDTKTEQDTGRKAIVVTFPSNQKYEQNKEQIEKLQKNLQSLQSEKAQLEKEYSKFGQKAGGSIAQKRRKEELEFELDLADKNIQRVKQKLRELNAF